MWSKENNRPNVTRRFLVALGFSLILHGLLFSKFGMISHGEMIARSSAMQISLVAPVNVLPISSELPVTRAPETSAPRQNRTITEKSEEATRTPPVPVKPSPSMPTTSASSAQESPQPNLSSGTPLRDQSGLVQRVEIEFELFSGVDRQLMGRGRHRYVSEQGEYYGVSVEQTLDTKEPHQGLPWKLEVSGRISGRGLSPELFEMQGSQSERLMALKEGLSGLSKPDHTTRKGRIRDGILDRQSLLYHFMLRPPELAGGKLWLTDGSNLGLFNYRIAGVESLSVNSFGAIQALKLFLETSDDSETIELWLAPDLHYLPLKVRHTDRQGLVTELMAVSLDYN
jgi:hypothetical protein